MNPSNAPLAAPTDKCSHAYPFRDGIMRPCEKCGEEYEPPLCSEFVDPRQPSSPVGDGAATEIAMLPQLDTTHGLVIPEDLAEDYDEIGPKDEGISSQGWRHYSNRLIERIAKREEELLGALNELSALKASQPSLPKEPRTKKLEDLARALFGVAYHYDPGRNAHTLQSIYSRAAVMLGITKEQMLQLRDDIEPPAAPNQDEADFNN